MQAQQACQAQQQAHLQARQDRLFSPPAAAAQDPLGGRYVRASKGRASGEEGRTLWAPSLLQPSLVSLLPQTSGLRVASGEMIEPRSVNAAVLHYYSHM